MRQQIIEASESERENFEEIIEVFSENREVAQLVAHYVRDVGVGRSSRLFSTKSDLDDESKSLFGLYPIFGLPYLRRINIFFCFSLAYITKKQYFCTPFTPLETIKTPMKACE